MNSKRSLVLLNQGNKVERSPSTLFQAQRSG